MISFRQVHKNYSADNPTLSNLNFDIEQGEMVFIQGPSGSGKSTLLNLIAAITPASQGEIIVDTLHIHKLSVKQTPLYRRRLGLIFQTPHLLKNRSVYENVALPLILAGFYRTEIPKRVNTALDKVGLLHKALALPGALSSGEQQRLNIARALVHKPSILLADEPTKNLDTHFAQEIKGLFSRFNQDGVTILVASQEQWHIDPLFSTHNTRRMDLQQGQIVCFN